MECHEWIELGMRKCVVELVYQKKLASTANQRVIWFRHVESIDEYHMVRTLYIADVSGKRVRGRPRLGWMDGVKVALGGRGMTMETA